MLGSKESEAEFLNTQQIATSVRAYTILSMIDTYVLQIMRSLFLIY